MHQFIDIPRINPELTKQILNRFWEKVDKGKLDECWIWKGSGDNHGYGQFSINGRPIGAHRVAWTIANGAIKNRLFCLHKCDNPSCVNSRHIWLGTQKDNMEDSRKKGRNHVPHGELSSLHKLTNEQVLEIRRLCNAGLSNKAIAKQFKLDKGHVYQIKAFRIWKHIGGERAKIQKPLAQDQKHTVRLMWKSGKTQREIASVMGVSQATVSYTIHKAK